MNIFLSLDLMKFLIVELIYILINPKLYIICICIQKFNPAKKNEKKIAINIL